MKQDYAKNEPTDPSGSPLRKQAAEPASEPAPAESDDEFPSEATRIDPAFLGGGAAPSASATKPAARPAAKPAASTSKPIRVDSPPEGGSKKLAALQSLSLDGGASSTRLPPPPKQSGGSTLPWILLGLVSAGIGGNWAWQKYHTAPQPTGPMVKTEVVTPTGGSGAALNAAGFVAARTPISVSSPVAGLLTEVKVDAGAKVKRGQIVAKLDDSAAQADHVATMAAVNDAERNYAETQRLYKYQAATIVDVSKARGQVMVSRATLSPINQRIEQAKIRSSVDGTVLEVDAHAGEAVAITGVIMKVADLSQMVAELDVVETDVPKTFVGQEVQCSSDVVTGHIYTGHVREVGEQADKTKGTVLVKVDITVADQALRPGMTIKGEFIPRKGDKPRIYVPKGALTPQGTVWIVGVDHKVAPRTVKIGPAIGSSIEVTDGLTGGERIVDDAAAVHEGQLIADPTPAAN